MMKSKFSLTLRTVLLVSMLWLNAIELWAQDEGGGASSSMKFGLKTGLVSSRYNIAGASSGGIKNDVLGGVLFQMGFANGLGLNFEALYTRMGAANVGGDLFFSIENKNNSTPVLFSDVTTQGIRVPILFNYSIPGIESDMRPYISVGTELGFNLSSKAINTSTYESNGSEYTFTTDQKLGGKIKMFDLAAVVGTGFVLSGQYVSYVFDLRYNLGLMNVNNAYSYYIDNAVYTRAFNASFGVTYDF